MDMTDPINQRKMALQKSAILKRIIESIKEMQAQNPDVFEKEDPNLETQTSKEIRLICEVEKIWIIFDADKNGSLEAEEVKQYLNTMIYPCPLLDDKQMGELCDLIDLDADGRIDKEEM